MSSSTTNGSAVDLDSRSVFVRGDLNALDILGFIKQWKGISVLQTCRLVKNGLYELTFHSLECADQLMDLGFSIMIGEKKAELRPANNCRKKVQIHGLPGSFKEELLRRYLQDIGTLDSLVPDSYSDDFSSVHTGVWHAIITSKSDPPPVIHMGEYTARLLYAGQKNTCWDCHSKHPKSAKCPDPLCRNCKKPGHLAASCSLPCSLCCQKHPFSKNCKLETFLAELAAPSDAASPSRHSSEIPSAPLPAPVTLPRLPAARPVSNHRPEPQRKRRSTTPPPRLAQNSDPNHILMNGLTYFDTCVRIRDMERSLENEDPPRDLRFAFDGQYALCRAFAMSYEQTLGSG